MFNRASFDKTLYDRRANSEPVVESALRGATNVNLALMVRLRLTPPLSGAGDIYASAVIRQFIGADISSVGSCEINELRLIINPEAELSGDGEIEPKISVKTPFEIRFRGSGGLSDSNTFVKQHMKQINISSRGDAGSRLVLNVYPESSIIGSGDVGIDNRFALRVYLESGPSGSGELRVRRIAFDMDILELNDISLEPGQTLVIDTDNFNVFKDGVLSVDSVTSDSIFIQLLPGENEIDFQTDEVENKELDVTFIWQNRWL
jgi:hypothetical protein